MLESPRWNCVVLKPRRTSRLLKEFAAAPYRRVPNQWHFVGRKWDYKVRQKDEPFSIRLMLAFPPDQRRRLRRAPFCCNDPSGCNKGGWNVRWECCSQSMEGSGWQTLRAATYSLGHAWRTHLSTSRRSSAKSTGSSTGWPGGNLHHDHDISRSVHGGLDSAAYAANTSLRPCLLGTSHYPGTPTRSQAIRHWR